MPRQPHQFRLLLARRRREIRDVPVRRDHQMSVVIWIEIEDGVTETPANQNEIVRGLVGGVAEDAGHIAGTGACHVFEPPRRPEAFHNGVGELESW